MERTERVQKAPSVAQIQKMSERELERTMERWQAWGWKMRGAVASRINGVTRLIEAEQLRRHGVAERTVWIEPPEGMRTRERLWYVVALTSSGTAAMVRSVRADGSLGSAATTHLRFYQLIKLRPASAELTRRVIVNLTRVALGVAVDPQNVKTNGGGR